MKDVNEDKIKRNDDGSVTVFFDRPVARKNGEMIGELTLRRPTGGDMEVFDKVPGDVAGSLSFVAALSGLPRGLVKRIDMADLRLVNAVVDEMTEGKSPESEDGGE